MNRIASAALATAVVAAAGVSVWQLSAGGAASASPATTVASRGDVVVTVGGVGKIIPGSGGASILSARGSGNASASGGASQAAGGGLADAGRLVYPQLAGHLTAVLVSAGEQVHAGQALVRIDPGAAVSNLVAARTAMEQAEAQLRLDRSGLSAQTLAATRAGVTTAVAGVAAARQALVRAIRVDHDTVAAARQQVEQARTVIRTGPVAAVAAVVAAQQALLSAREALIATRAANAQQAATLQHVVDAARQDLAGDDARLARDRATERNLCGTTSPTITASTSAECAAAASAVSADEQLTAKDTSAVQAALDGVAQGEISSRQAEYQARSQIASAASALGAARDQLAALRTANRQLLATARSGLTQARSKAAESESQARSLLHAAVVARANAEEALRALVQGAPAALIAQDRSKIVAAKAQLAAARSAVDQSTLRSPVAGTVTWVFAAPGAAADIATPVAAIADLAHLAVGLDLSEFDAARVHAGLRAVVSVDALGGRRFPGTVEFLSLIGVDNGGVVTFPVRVGVPNLRGGRPGMNVSVRIVVAERRNVVVLPLEAVTGGGRTVEVTVVAPSGRQSTRAVRLGLADNKNVEVRSGLHAGERVLLGSAQGG